MSDSALLRDHSARGATWAVVPLKSPETAKMRLAAVLAPQQRRELFFSMARAVLNALARTRGIERVLVVSASDEVAAFARGFGAQIVPQAHEHGTKQAFITAMQIARHHGVQSLLMIPGDLPLVHEDALDALLAAAPATGAVVVPDRRHSGTNALLSSPPDVIPLCFGDDSFSRHLAAARDLGVTARVFEHVALALDLDVAEDLEQLRAQLRQMRAGDARDDTPGLPLLASLDAGALHGFD